EPVGPLPCGVGFGKTRRHGDDHAVCRNSGDGARSVALEFCNAVEKRGRRVNMTPAKLGGIAQLVERLVRNEKVRGSNPLTSSLRSLRRRERRLSRRSLSEGGHYATQLTLNRIQKVNGGNENPQVVQSCQRVHRDRFAR